MQALHPIALALASILTGFCAGLAALTVSHVVNGKRKAYGTFENSRREELRKASSLYRILEPLIDELSRFFPENHKSQQLEHHLNLKGDGPPWNPAEYMAIKTIEATMIGLATIALVSLFGFPVLGLLLGGGTAMAYPSLARRSAIQQGKARLKTLKLRTPFAIDQISLMMEAGAGFEDSLRTVVSDNPNHPLSEEFAEVIRQMSLGRPRKQALAGFRDRMSDDDISEIVFAIVKGEELGTPLSNILREQATQMRLKRSQWGEKAASEAEVQMVFPGMITMIACLLVIVAPILLPIVITLLEG